MEIAKQSPTIHEAFVDRHRKTDAAGDDVMATRSEATRALREACERAADTTAKVMQNRMLTEAGRHVQAREANSNILEQATRRVDAANAKAKAEIAALDARLAGPPGPRDGVAMTLASEIRAALS